MKSLFKKISKGPAWISRKITIALSKPVYDSKVFCVGFNKTGTTSCGKAIQMLGYRHSTFNKRVWRQYENGEIAKVLQYTAKLDSVDDLPWLKEDMIPVLDRVFPNSKFIYLTRDEESWKQSIYHWSFKIFGKYPDLEKKIEEYRKHREFVLNYFADRPKEQFLVLDIKDKNGYDKLARFLDKTAPQKHFPHHNKT